MINKGQISIYGPMNFFVMYIIFTLVLHVFGPWDYKDEVIWPVIIYMMLVLILFILGYYSVAKKYRKNIRKNSAVSLLNFKRNLLWAKIGVVVNVLLIIFIAYADYSEGRLSFSSLFNPGQAYINALELNKEGGNVSLLVQIKTLISPIIFFSNVFLLFNYSKIGGVWKVLLLSALVMNLGHGALTKAAQKGFFDIFILLASVGVIKVYFDKIRYIKFIKLIGIFLICVIIIFAFFQISRMVAYDALDYTGAHRMWLNRDSVIFDLFGDYIGLAISLFIGYLSQGYYGLSLSLQLPFEWTYGFGNSFALTSYAEQYLGMTNIFYDTYPSRMDDYFDWPARMYWHTFFPWVASDVTFIGAILLMYLIGVACAKSFIDGVVYESTLGICVFYFLSTLMIYLPANNQLMQTREMMIGFVIILFVWLIRGGRYRR